MRVLHVVDALQGGGIQRHVAHVTRNLTALGVPNAVAALLPPVSEDTPQVALDPATPYLATPVAPPERGGGALRGLRAIDSRWQRASTAWLAETMAGFDILHAHSLWSTAIGVQAARRTRKPSVAATHDSAFCGAEASGQEGGLLRALKFAMHRRAVSRASHVVAVAEWLAAAMLERMPRLRGRVTGIANGVDRRAGLGETSPDAGHVACISMLKADKNHARLIEAWSRVLGEGVEATLSLYGLDLDPAQTTARALRQCAEALCPEGGIRFAGWTADPDAAVRAAWLFVSLSLREASPIAVADAVACGAPCVLSDIPAHREIAGDGGAALYVPPRDVDAAACALRSVMIDSNLRARMALAARRRASELPTWADTAARLVAVYASLAPSGG